MAAEVATWVASWVRTTWAPVGLQRQEDLRVDEHVHRRATRAVTVDRGGHRRDPGVLARVGVEGGLEPLLGRRAPPPPGAASSAAAPGVPAGRRCGPAPPPGRPRPHRPARGPACRANGVPGGGRTATAATAGLHRRCPRCAGARHAGRSGPGPPCSRPAGRSRRSATRPGRTPRRRRRGHSPGLVDVAQARSRPRGAPGRCARPRTGPRPPPAEDPSRRAEAGSSRPTAASRPCRSGAAWAGDAWAAPGPLSGAWYVESRCVSQTTSPTTRARNSERPATHQRGRPATPCVLGGLLEARGQPGRTAPTYGIM